jgi:hypothetical protein
MNQHRSIKLVSHVVGQQQIQPSLVGHQYKVRGILGALNGGGYVGSPGFYAAIIRIACGALVEC